MLAVTTARLHRLGDLATTTRNDLGGLAAATAHLQLAGNASNESLEFSKEGHLVYLLTRMLFSAVATSTRLLGAVTTTALERLLGLGTVLTATRSGGGREVRRRVGRSGFGRKESKGVPPLLVRGLGGNVRRRGGGHRIINYL